MTSTVEPFRLGYRPGLDGLRAIAVLAVLGTHLSTDFPHEGAMWTVLSRLKAGYLGVDIFLVLSGFLITSLLLEELREHSRIDLRNFYVRRALRLLPALVALLVGTAVVVVVTSPAVAEGSTFWQATAATIAYGANWFQLVIPFEERAHLLAHTWSLSIEEQFYVVWPVAMWFVVPRLGRHAVRGFAVMAVLGAAVVPFLVALGVSGERVYYGTDTRGANLILGAALAVAAHRGLVDRLPLAVARAGAWAAFAFGVLLIATNLSRPTSWGNGLFAAVGVAVAAAIVWVLRDPSSAAGRVMASQPAVTIGRLSYSLYLWHWPIFLLIPPGRFGISLAQTAALRLIVAFGAACGSYWLVEQRFLRLRHRFVPRPVAAAPAVAPSVAPSL